MRYGSERTPWGRLWVALGAEGVVAVALGSEPVGKLAEEVRRRHPVRLVHDPEAVAAVLEELEVYLRGARRTLAFEPDYGGALAVSHARLPGDAPRALRRARRLRRDRRRVASARYAHAVGTALAKNPFRLLVPDHRVIVESGGEAGGFRFGRG